MARSRLRETMKEAGLKQGDKPHCMELCVCKERIIQQDTAGDGEDVITVKEEFIGEEDCIKKSNSIVGDSRNSIETGQVQVIGNETIIESVMSDTATKGMQIPGEMNDNTVEEM